MSKHSREQKRETIEQEKSAVLKRLLSEIKSHTLYEERHTQTCVEIEVIIGRNLTKIENEVWSAYRQKNCRTIRNAQKASMVAEEKAEKRRIEELKIFSLLGLKNEELCLKIIRLETQHENNNGPSPKRGKAATKQLPRALALHTEAQIEQISVQIDTFTPEQKHRAESAIFTIKQILTVLKLRRYEELGILHLSDSELKEYFYCMLDPRLAPMHQLISIKYRIDEIPNFMKLKTFLDRIKSLAATDSFTIEMKQNIIATIYIVKIEKILTQKDTIPGVNYSTIISDIKETIKTFGFTNVQYEVLFQALKTIKLNTNIFPQNTINSLLSLIPTKTKQTIQNTPKLTKERSFPEVTFAGKTYPNDFLFFPHSEKDIGQLQNGAMIGIVSKTEDILIWDGYKKIAIRTKRTIK